MMIIFYLVIYNNIIYNFVIYTSKVSVCMAVYLS